MPYGYLIAATVMILGVCQGHSSIASFSMLRSALRSLFAIAELLVMKFARSHFRDASAVTIWMNSLKGSRVCGF